VITDYRMDEMDGLRVLEAVKTQAPETDVIMITAFGSIELAVEAMQKGAKDYLPKPFPPEALRLKVEKALEDRATRLERERLGEENRYLREEIDSRYGKVVGSSAKVQDLLAKALKVASTDSSILIYGESGTGKEVVARVIHNQSSRGNGPFIKVNCGALPKELVESELFGHERGAFTGAVRQKKGKFELAHGGTIFLDEVGDLPLDTQVKLLRVLQEREFERVGGEHTLSADVRVLAATNQPLKAMVDRGAFRADLFYRLEVIPLHLPPLRERREDIPELVEHFLRKKCQEINLPIKRLAGEAMKALTRYQWPGNVRELENVIERTIVLADGEEVGLRDLPLFFEEYEGEQSGAVVDPVGEPAADRPLTSLSLNQQLETLERELIVRAMDRARGVKTQAAEILGIKTSALYYKLGKYGLE
jgi:two-component system response regulator HydG